LLGSKKVESNAKDQIDQVDPVVASQLKKLEDLNPYPETGFKDYYRIDGSGQMSPENEQVTFHSSYIETLNYFIGNH